MGSPAGLDLGGSPRVVWALFVRHWSDSVAIILKRAEKREPAAKVDAEQKKASKPTLAERQSEWELG